MIDHKDKTMTVKRIVRKDFDREKQYSVNVLGCTDEEKKNVQQAFFDAGIPWGLSGKIFKYMNAAQYSNTLSGGKVTTDLMYGSSTEDCNMTAKEFMDLVYEPMQEGHIHAENMAHYSEDAKTTAIPWELWQVKCEKGIWHRCQDHPRWKCAKEYRRKLKTHIVHGVEIPDLRVSPEYGDHYYVADPLSRTFVTGRMNNGKLAVKEWVNRGIVYQHTEEGRQAAILHSKAMLGIATCR